MYPGNSEPITVCRKVYQINQVLLKSVSTSSVLSWYIGNVRTYVRRLVPLMLPSTRIHVCMYQHMHMYACEYILTSAPKFKDTLMFLVLTWGNSPLSVMLSSERTKAEPNALPFLENEMDFTFPSKSC